MSYDMTFEQRLARIDLTAVMTHVKAETGLSDEDLSRAEDLYRKFLSLCARKPAGGVVPPRLVDVVWHTHITFTRQYASDCELLFGEFFHHTPDISEEESLSGFEKTVTAYSDQFGINLLAYGTTPPVWMEAAGCKG